MAGGAGGGNWTGNIRLRTAAMGRELNFERCSIAVVATRGLWREAVRRARGYRDDLRLDLGHYKDMTRSDPRMDLPAEPPSYFSFFSAAMAIA
jgi:hypothetical protein